MDPFGIDIEGDVATEGNHRCRLQNLLHLGVGDVIAADVDRVDRVDAAMDEIALIPTHHLPTGAQLGAAVESGEVFVEILSITIQKMIERPALPSSFRPRLPRYPHRWSFAPPLHVHGVSVSNGSSRSLNQASGGSPGVRILSSDLWL